MPRIAFSLAVVCLLGGALALAQSEAQTDDLRDSDNVLVWYDFEDDIDTGPYTLMVFEGAKGRVDLSPKFRYSGFRSVEIRDVAADGEFAELQGYFPDKWSGQLYMHFALLVAEPEEMLNIAFAGIAHFSMREHGIGVWLKMRNGVLYHVTGGKDVPLMEVDAFVWYVVDLWYDVDRGVYDLVIRVEGEATPLVALRAQTNAVGIPGSSLRKYSFIGDTPGLDTSNAWFYVDDILILNDVPVSEEPFVAPGRRMLFVDLFERFQTQLHQRPGCAPVLGYEDFDLNATDLAELGASGHRALLVLDGSEDREIPDELTAPLRHRLEAMRLWREGCRTPSVALERFEEASELVPGAKIYDMSRVLALVAAKRWELADRLLLEIYALWRDDPRFPALAAAIGLARGELDDAEQWLGPDTTPAPKTLSHPLVKQLWSGDIGPRLVDELRREFPARWPRLVRVALSADLRFYVLLRQGRYDEARDYSKRMVIHFQRMNLPIGRWLERGGDAAFYAEDLPGARALYERSLQHRHDPAPVFLKLSDVHFAMGDLDRERMYREKIYGSLRLE